MTLGGFQTAGDRLLVSICGICLCFDRVGQAVDSMLHLDPGLVEEQCCAPHDAESSVRSLAIMDSDSLAE